MTAGAAIRESAPAESAATAESARAAVTGLEAVWVELVGVAMLGTDRRPLPPAGPGGLSSFGVGGDGATALLDRAAAVVAAGRAGAVPEAAGPALPPCPADRRPPCPGPAARRLGRMLDGRHPDLLPEWLAASTAAGLAAPPEHVVPLLSIGRAAPHLLPVVLDAAGPLAAWLEQIAPGAGAPPSPADPILAWEQGRGAERVAAFRLVRERDPAPARALLSAGLAGEKVEVRVGCYQALAAGLGPADEPLLEAALDDRAAPVRQVAAGLLAALPGSPWAARMARRARSMVGIVGPPGHDRFDVQLVAPLPARWERDGIDPAAPPGTSLGAHVLRQVVAGTPLDEWEALAPPAHLVVLAAEHELGPMLLEGWSQAAARQRRADWARLLVGETGDPALVPVLDPDDLAALAGRVATPDSVITPLGLAALAGAARPWPVALAEAVAGAVLALFAERRTGRHQAPALRRLARTLDPPLLVPLADALAGLGLPPPLDGVRDDLMELLRFRAALLEELTAP